MAGHCNEITCTVVSNELGWGRLWQTNNPRTPSPDVAVWNKWRRGEAGSAVDLSYADLRQFNLQEVDFSGPIYFMLT